MAFPRASVLTLTEASGIPTPIESLLSLEMSFESDLGATRACLELTQYYVTSFFTHQTLSNLDQDRVALAASPCNTGFCL